MPRVLELPQLVEHHGPSERDDRRGRIKSELHPQRPPQAQLAPELLRRHDLGGTGEQGRQVFRSHGLLLCQATAAIKPSVGRFTDVIVLNTTLERRRLSARIASVLLMPSERFLAT